MSKHGPDSDKKDQVMDVARVIAEDADEAEEMKEVPGLDVGSGAKSAEPPLLSDEGDE